MGMRGLVLGGARVVLYMAVSEINVLKQSLTIDQTIWKASLSLHGHSLTWLEGDFTKHHPDVRKVVLALNSTGHVIVEWDGDEAGTGVDIIHHGAEWYGCSFPVQLWAKVTHHLLKGLHSLGEHVVAVHLNQFGLKGRENTKHYDGCK